MGNPGLRTVARKDDAIGAAEQSTVLAGIK
jgi:hypothetical protein